MKNIFSAIKLTFLCLILFSVLYPFLIWRIAKASPNKGKGETLEVNGKVVGFKLIGQSFTNDKYFWGRPSAVNYNAAGSGGSNKGASNSDYLKDVQIKVDRFLVHHPYLTKKEIPSEMVTASGSGLDPHISPNAALIQVKRISKTRNISEKEITQLVERNIQKPLFGIFGTQTVNVLQLNIELDNLK